MKKFLVLFLFLSTIAICQSAPTQGQILISHLSPQYSAASDEFVVLFNNTDQSIELNGYRLQYFSASGASNSLLYAFTSSTILGARKHILLSSNITVTVGSVSVNSDYQFSNGMATSGQLVFRETANTSNIIYAAAWGTVTGYTAGMTDAAAWSGAGMISLSQSGTTYTRTSYNSSNTQYSWIAAASISTLPNSSDAALPVELTSFTSEVVDNKVLLNWTTATEVNNYGFEILRSAQNDNWKKIGFVQGNGNSNSPKNYSFTDEPKGGKEFQYRLKQIDFDGSYEYSEITTAILENVSGYKLDQNYPNPFNPITKINYTLPERTNVKLRVYDLLAQKIAELVNSYQEAGRYEVTFDGSNFPSGAYFYKLEAGDYVEVKKLLLIK